MFREKRKLKFQMNSKKAGQNKRMLLITRFDDKIESIPTNCEHFYKYINCLIDFPACIQLWCRYKIIIIDYSLVVLDWTRFSRIRFNYQHKFFNNKTEQIMLWTQLKYAKLPVYKADASSHTIHRNPLYSVRPTLVKFCKRISIQKIFIIIMMVNDANKFVVWEISDIPESCATCNEKSTLVQLTDSVMFNRIPITNYNM